MAASKCARTCPRDRALECNKYDTAFCNRACAQNSNGACFRVRLVSMAVPVPCPELGLKFRLLYLNFMTWVAGGRAQTRDRLLKTHVRFVAQAKASWQCTSLLEAPWPCHCRRGLMACLTDAMATPSIVAPPNRSCTVLHHVAQKTLSTCRCVLCTP